MRNIALSVVALTAAANAGMVTATLNSVNPGVGLTATLNANNTGTTAGQFN